MDGNYFDANPIEIGDFEDAILREEPKNWGGSGDSDGMQGRTPISRSMVDQQRGRIELSDDSSDKFMKLE